MYCSLVSETIDNIRICAYIMGFANGRRSDVMTVTMSLLRLNCHRLALITFVTLRFIIFMLWPIHATAIYGSALAGGAN